ncbi:antibiotic biosynthesis monooxygenase [Streptomyces sp. NPDC046821]|uniref:putative quinol monooxygenase n=1 Tax=Streptomyces sp. NPDC046821 TaxID=3154702 RepID=UPI0033F332B0
MSVVVIVTIFPGPEHRAEVVSAVEKAILQVHEEPGVEFYALLEGDDRLMMIEKYESAQAQAEHAKRPALTGLLAALDGKLTRELDVQVLTPHPAGDPRKGALPSGA